jgi:hypothetical protein
MRTNGRHIVTSVSGNSLVSLMIHREAGPSALEAKLWEARLIRIKAPIQDDFSDLD